jgi:hypothetical protein
MKLTKIAILLIIAINIYAKEVTQNNNDDIKIIDNAVGTQRINVSQRDVNRLVFPSKILHQINSKEKSLIATNKENELFVKFTPYKEDNVTTVKDKVVTKGDSKILYDKNGPADLYVVTKDKTYQIILIPTDRDLVTIYFTESFKNKKEQLFKFNNNEYVDVIVNKLITPYLKNGNLSGFQNLAISSKRKQLYLDQDGSIVNISLAKKLTSQLFNIYEYKIVNPSTIPLHIKNTKSILDEFNKEFENEEIKAYTIFYDNRIYKILPNDFAKLVIVSSKFRE